MVESQRNVHATFAANHALRRAALARATTEMQERTGEVGRRRCGEKAFGRHVINLKKGREREREAMKGIRDKTYGKKILWNLQRRNGYRHRGMIT